MLTTCFFKPSYCVLVYSGKATSYICLSEQAFNVPSVPQSAGSIFSSAEWSDVFFFLPSCTAAALHDYPGCCTNGYWCSWGPHTHLHTQTFIKNSWHWLNRKVREVWPARGRTTNVIWQRREKAEDSRLETRRQKKTCRKMMRCMQTEEPSRHIQTDPWPVIREIHVCFQKGRNNMWVEVSVCAAGVSVVGNSLLA